MDEKKADGEASSSWKPELGSSAETAGTSQSAAEKVEKTPLTFEVNEGLATTAFVHLQTMQQASRAIDHCETSEWFSGTRTHVEAEKVLLVATQARLAALNEMQRLRGEEETPSDGRQRSLVVSKIILPIIVEALELSDGLLHYFVLLFQHDHTVRASALMSSDDLASRNGGICLDFKVDDIQFSPLQENFNVKVDIFALRSTRRGVAKRKDYPTKKAKTKNKGAHSGKKAGCSSREPPESVPGGPSSVRLPSFRHLGFFLLDASTCGGCTVPVTMMPGCFCLEDSAFVQSELLPC
ncbi:hypothetical protein HPB48_015538 [Haemaphysalis longicornis]|uniref:Anillin homology domain-containing protein n=1 Tax=Haemaphysalis longicornis TaxID=44386 RepID=A0A9J6FKM9_HAELO|nr:hypothetical protein HPB48_015538 [Haemaphysalis longicornis]